MRLMILGGGSSQISVFRRARELGIETVFADRDGGAPARVFADRFAEASTFDPEAVTRAGRAEGCDAILAVGTDQPVYTAAVASHRLGLPFPLTPEQAAAVTNKRVMKARFDAAGIPAAPWGVFQPGEGAWRAPELTALRPPYVVKPVDSQGQRGIIRAADRAAVEAHYPVARSFSREDGVLVEEFFPSVEVTVSGWAHTPQDVEIWTITDRVTIDNPPGLGVCLAHRYPSLHAGHRHGGLTDTIRDLTRRIVAAFQLAHCPIYFQMLVSAGTEAGPVLVNEIAVRLGGAYEDQSIPLVTGIDILTRQLTAVRDAVLRGGYGIPAGAGPEHAMAGAQEGASAGAPAEPVPRPPQRPEPPARHVSTYFAVPLMFAHPGTVARLEGDAELRRVPGIAECRFLLPEGTVIRPMENSTQRIAYAVLHADSAVALNTLVDTLFDRLRVLAPDGTNLLMDTRGEVRRNSPWR
ncbi:MAG: hypothetical protein PF508_07375 [Spirochaeta sp.]|jgi:biotin carboxylase|nr:hypothetical protein [Spirochaeta sp.]